MPDRPFRDVGTDTLRRLASNHQERPDGRCAGEHSVNISRPRWPCEMRTMADTPMNLHNYARGWVVK